MAISANRPSSGDRLVDWIFRQFLLLLNNRKLKIRRKRSVVKFRGKRRWAVRGISDMTAGPDNRGIEITISSAKSVHVNRHQEVETLIHELAHILFPKVRERFIRVLEDILVAKFIKEQRRLLGSFLPRRPTKK